MRVNSCKETDRIYPDTDIPMSVPIIILKCDFCYATSDLYGYDPEVMEFEAAEDSAEHICETCLNQFAHLAGMTWSAKKTGSK